MGKEVLSYAKYFHCSCHATWLPCKTSIAVTEYLLFSFIPGRALFQSRRAAEAWVVNQ